MALLEIKEPGGNSEIENEEQICIGIDFGTTNCVCSIKRGDEIQLIPDELGNFIINPGVTAKNLNKPGA